MQSYASMKLLFFVVYFNYFLSEICGENSTTFFNRKNDIIRSENQLRTGGSLALSDAENKVNSQLMKAKFKEIQDEKDSGTYPPSEHFFHAKASIEKSSIFKLIKKMPKGAVLHLHDTSMVHAQWLVQNASYRPDLYMCFNNANQLRFKFSKQRPFDPGCFWESVDTYRHKSGNVSEFDARLYQSMSMEVDNPEKAYPNQNKLWVVFLEKFAVAGGIISYEPVFRDYFYQALEDFYEDNVQYIEVRCLLSGVYDLDGNQYDEEKILQIYIEVAEKFKKDHPDFSGVKIIYSALRSIEKSDVLFAIKKAVALYQKYPDWFVGFDLVGQEDTGHPLSYYIEELLYPSQLHVDLPYYFHAGETDWEGLSVDDNLIDALLLNTTRIGHAFAITKHPKVLEMIKNKGVAVELNPVSNQVLGLVHDLRDHPASHLLANSYPVVISADDPGLWGAKGVSYDFYEVFMGVAGYTADLAMLKQLAMDSIKYSAMSKAEKTMAMTLWQKKWNVFIEEATYLGLGDIVGK